MEVVYFIFFLFLDDLRFVVCIAQPPIRIERVSMRVDKKLIPMNDKKRTKLLLFFG